MKPVLSLLTLALFNIQSSHAAYFTNPMNMTDNRYPARATGQFLAGGNQQLGGFGDAMLPFIEHNDHIVFADGGIMGGQDRRMALSAGLGTRGITSTALGRGVVGAYLFTDYYQTSLNSQFWQLNPGIEWLKEQYEVRLQGYIPVNKRNQTYLNTYASNIPVSVINDSGNANTLSGATAHSMFDTPVSLMEEAGPGVELEAGRFIDYGRGMWLRVGGYHFSYNNANSINGVEANIEATINKNVSLLIQDNYDNQNKNRFSVGLRVSFGGASAPQNSLEKQMTSPIIRHIARQSYGEAEPTRTNFKATGPTNTFSNVWFFGPGGMYPVGAATTFSNCTAEHPCSTIDSATAAKIATLSPDAELFFETGSYIIPDNGGSDWVELQDGQSVWGRNTGWMTPATGSNRPLINGALLWGADNSVIASGFIYNMQVSNTNQVIPLADFTNGDSNDSVFAVAATGNLTVQNSVMQATNTNDNVTVLGIAAGSDIFVQNTTANTLNTGNATFNGSYARASSVKAIAGNVIASNVNSSATTNGQASTGSSTGSHAIYSNNNAIVTDSNLFSSTTGNSSGTNSVSIAQGIKTILGYADVSHSTITSQTNGNATSGGRTTAVGVDANSSATVSNGSIINASASGSATGSGSFARAYGVYTNVDYANISNSIITAATTGNAQTSGVTAALGVVVNTYAMVTNGSRINASTSGNATGSGSRASALGVLSYLDYANISHSIVTATTTGNAQTSGSVEAIGVEAETDISVTASNINASTSGSTSGGSSIGWAVGLTALGNAAVTNSVINVQTDGVLNQGTNNATGLSVNNATISGSTIMAQASGTIAGGTATATGINGIGTFPAGTNASSIIAISQHDVATTITGAVSNNNGSQCSTDGINFHPC